MSRRNAGNYLNAAEEILRRAKEPLHYREITERAMQKGLINPTGYTPDATMRGQLNTAVKNGDHRFEKLAPGLFKLKQR